MIRRFRLGTIPVEVTLKDIKHVHLSVHPPAGRVRIAAPARMQLDTIRIFAISKLGWIKQQQRKLRDQPRETRREYLPRESHWVWGQRYLLAVEHADQAPTITLRPRRMVLTVRPDTSPDQRARIVDAWYRAQIREALPALLAKWEKRLGVSATRWFVQRMKTKWGSCNPATGSIRLNTELAKKPPECLEYIVVHELVHLIEPTHNERFVALMNRHLPRWQHLRQVLNRLPVRHEGWQY
ncbi:MAG: M48 family metallopeptidase [Pirellulales bacterium]|nr:M48 family metallopeptidase [Pirellulales bacterium]